MTNKKKLPPRERRLVVLYRQLSPQHQRDIERFIRALAGTAGKV